MAHLDRKVSGSNYFLLVFGFEHCLLDSKVSVLLGGSMRAFVGLQSIDVSLARLQPIKMVDPEASYNGVSFGDR